MSQSKLTSIQEQNKKKAANNVKEKKVNSVFKFGGFRNITVINEDDHVVVGEDRSSTSSTSSQPLPTYSAAPNSLLNSQISTIKEKVNIQPIQQSYLRTTPKDKTSYKKVDILNVAASNLRKSIETRDISSSPAADNNDDVFPNQTSSREAVPAPEYQQHQHISQSHNRNASTAVGSRVKSIHMEVPINLPIPNSLSSSTSSSSNNNSHNNNSHNNNSHNNNNNNNNIIHNSNSNNIILRTSPNRNIRVSYQDPADMRSTTSATVAPTVTSSNDSETRRNSFLTLRSKTISTIATTVSNHTSSATSHNNNNNHTDNSSANNINNNNNNNNNCVIINIPPDLMMGYLKLQETNKILYKKYFIVVACGQIGIFEKQMSRRPLMPPYGEDLKFSVSLAQYRMEKSDKNRIYLICDDHHNVNSSIIGSSNNNNTLNSDGNSRKSTTNILLVDENNIGFECFDSQICSITVQEWIVAFNAHIVYARSISNNNSR